jgi:hypothetical protein
LVAGEKSFVHKDQDDSQGQEYRHDQANDRLLGHDEDARLSQICIGNILNCNKLSFQIFSL